MMISETIDGVGGVMNAATDREYTVYYAKVARPHLDLAVDDLGAAHERAIAWDRLNDTSHALGRAAGASLRSRSWSRTTASPS